MALYEAFCFRYLWKWFVVDKFHLPMLTYVEAIGLALVVSLITHQDIARPKETEPGKNQVMRILFRPGFCLLIGWSFHHFAS